MLEDPQLDVDKIAACLHAAYGLRVAEVNFLPLGADLNTVVYRVLAAEGSPYFLKLRRGNFEIASVALPKFLSDRGIAPIIAPLVTQTGRLWSELDAFKVILYPFVDGRDGYQVGLSDDHWRELGHALKQLHTTRVPPALRQRLPQESYSPQWRERVKASLKHAEKVSGANATALATAAYLIAKRDAIRDLVGRADGLAQSLQAQPPEPVVCHSDLHAGNLFMAASGALYIVDWDNPILAPKERDLMFIGGGQVGGWHTPEAELALFYPSYGETPIDPRALAYYRYERIIEDIAVECEQIFSTTEESPDRKQAFLYLQSNFKPGGVLEITYQADQQNIEEVTGRVSAD